MKLLARLRRWNDLRKKPIYPMTDYERLLFAYGYAYRDKRPAIKGKIVN